MKKKKVLVAMSGGVDSSVAAALLQEEGHEVAGATIRTWASGQCKDLNTRACCGISGVEDAREVADTLDIPYWVFNFEKEFKKHVVDHFASEYLRGRTPNPCVSCNEHIKFRLFLERARQLGYDFIATGHYAQLEYRPEQDQFCIREGSDETKDQSYVLFPLTRDILQYLLLPIGKHTKKEIRSMAQKRNLCVMDKPDSQEICFIPSNNYREFMEKDHPGGAPREGVIRTKEGKVLGKHQGYFHFTRGQRRGLGVAYSEKLYVIETLPETNEVIVGTKEEVFGRRCRAAGFQWFIRPDSTSLKAQVKIRSQHRKAAASIHMIDEKNVEIIFDDVQDAITPGQGAVVYDGPCVLGGGWIDQVS